MSDSTPQAFIGCPIPATGLLSWADYRLVPLSCRRSSPEIVRCAPQARSMESYREGSRFGGDNYPPRGQRQEYGVAPGKSGRKGEGRRDNSQRREMSQERETPEGTEITQGKDTPQQPAKSRKVRIGLASGLTEMRVTSMETSGFMIRSGCVKVNGEVVRDGKVKVNRFEDVISVNGKEYGTVEANVKGGGGEEGEEEDLEDLPRLQRDFYRPGFERTTDVHKKYSRKIDRGFYSGRRYQSGK